LGDVARLLDEGTLSSVDLVEAYVAQIKKHNISGAKLNPILSLVAENTALDHAKTLDEERAAGKVRSRVHGVPFLVKVLRNTWGSFATSQLTGGRTTYGPTSRLGSQQHAGPLH
jgi:Asp-tRNA(Asn)/Glu-tRNA(Gln) amidotransferase A subunit family amidase